MSLPVALVSLLRNAYNIGDFKTEKHLNLLICENKLNDIVGHQEVQNKRKYHHHQQKMNKNKRTKGGGGSKGRRRIDGERGIYGTRKRIGGKSWIIEQETILSASTKNKQEQKKGG